MNRRLEINCLSEDVGPKDPMRLPSAQTQVHIKSALLAPLAKDPTGTPALPSGPCTWMGSRSTTIRPLLARSDWGESDSLSRAPSRRSPLKAPLRRSMAHRGTVSQGLSALVIEDAGEVICVRARTLGRPVACLGCGTKAVRGGATAGAELVLTNGRATGRLPAETAGTSTSFTIFEGTSEIQRMIIGRAVTGLDVR